MWDAWDVRCSTCVMFWMGGVGFRMFAGLSEFGLQNVLAQ